MSLTRNQPVFFKITFHKEKQEFGDTKWMHYPNRFLFYPSKRIISKITIKTRWNMEELSYKNSPDKLVIRKTILLMILHTINWYHVYRNIEVENEEGEK